MRYAHDWGRASGRPHRSAPVGRKSLLVYSIVCAGAAAIAACSSPSASDTASTNDPAGPVSPGNVDTRLEESTRSVIDGVAYPLVAIEPAGDATLNVGEQATFSAQLSEGRNQWPSCCSTWTSSNPSVASVKVIGSGLLTGEHAVVEAHSPGRVTITATTESQTTGALTVTVSGKGGSSTGSGSSSGGYSSGGSSGSGNGSKGAGSSSSGSSGSKHEPGGMATQINTGSITSTGIVTMLSKWSMGSTGSWAGNLGVVPGGTGLRITYRPSLQAGNSPVQFGLSVPSAGTGWYYQRMKVRFSSNWTNGNNPAIKLCEPRTFGQGTAAGPTENDVIAGWVNGDPTKSYLTVLLQGPYSHYRDLRAQPEDAQSNVSDGNWHTMEVLFTPESSPGAGNGTYEAWVDGVEIARYTDVTWLARGNRPGWPYLMFDPVYGGVQSNPPYTMYWDVDQIYVSTK